MPFANSYFFDTNCGHFWFSGGVYRQPVSWLETRQQVPRWGLRLCRPSFSLSRKVFFGLSEILGNSSGLYSSGKFMFMKNASGTFIIMYFCILVWAPFYESYIRQISFIQFPILFCVINKITSFSRDLYLLNLRGYIVDWQQLIIGYVFYWTNKSICFIILLYVSFGFIDGVQV